MRGLSQQQLAQKIGTQQPAIARIEAGLTNIQASTIVELAKALGATVRVDLEPVELLALREPPKRWWERPEAYFYPEDSAAVDIPLIVLRDSDALEASASPRYLSLVGSGEVASSTAPSGPLSVREAAPSVNAAQTNRILDDLG